MGHWEHRSTTSKTEVEFHGMKIVIDRRARTVCLIALSGTRFLEIQHGRRIKRRGLWKDAWDEDHTYKRTNASMRELGGLVLNPSLLFVIGVQGAFLAESTIPTKLSFEYIVDSIQTAISGYNSMPINNQVITLKFSANHIEYGRYDEFENALTAFSQAPAIPICRDQINFVQSIAV